jgi:hypothetical protein
MAWRQLLLNTPEPDAVGKSLVSNSSNAAVAETSKNAETVTSLPRLGLRLPAGRRSRRRSYESSDEVLLSAVS